ncbi:tRNA synthetases class I, catalytic domain-containing protein [Globomyces pollinis-pini]|nr:tRNA synthetases class I, catalytic domain-containing protein [Globomyces pollinis-pini]
MDSNHLISLFKGIGLNDDKAKETAANKKLAPNLELAIVSANATDGVEKSKGALLYTLASTITKNSVSNLPLIASYIAQDKLLSSDQISAAIKYCEKNATVDSEKFEKECGVGVVITHEQITTVVGNLIASRKADLDKKRYQMLGVLLGALRNELRWANSLAVKEELEAQMLAYLGPKDERDDLKALKKKEKSLKATQQTSAVSLPENNKVEDLAKSTKYIFQGELAALHKPGENPQINPKLMEEHLKRTGGKVITRFPPEPNGFLHIGHAKAINVNFGYAKAFDGITYLRYDDTNPEAEEGEYFTAIKDTVEWLGFSPYKITYSSDHFQKLYELAVHLIKIDKAYVCFCTGEEIHEHRGGESKGPRTACVHRDRPIKESLAEFENMKAGKYEEGIATLRMKMDLQNPNPQFWDLVAYRVLYTPHHRTADKWCIYPTYDYTHCLCDSFEDITHSMCTTEFQLSRESYYWLVDALEIYKPVQWEYGRLSLTHTVLSKRKLNKLVTDGHVSGWDDPRLHTIASIKRRGFTPQAVNAFVREMGVTTANTTTPVERLENYVRDHLNEIAPRLFLLSEPLKVTITNVDASFSLECVVPDKASNSDQKRVLNFTKTIYIDAADFREVDDDPNFFRLAPGKSVGLLHVPFPITCTDIIRSSNGDIVEINARYESSIVTKPKTYIQWLNSDSACTVQLRLYNKLFLHPNPQSKEEVPNGWLTDLNPDALQVFPSAMVEPAILGKPVGYTFQAVRVGYFCVDKDTDASLIVLNRTVTLKEDNKKSK